MLFMYNCLDHFKKDLLSQFPENRTEHFLVIIEPNKPVMFGNTEEQYYAIFGNDDPKYDLSIQYPNGTYFFNEIGKYMYGMKICCGEWRTVRHLSELPPQIKATLSLLNIPFARADENE